mgnify:CR=1 FL=1
MNVHVWVLAYVDNYAKNKLKNPGEADEACLNWKIYVDDVQQNWSSRVNDLNSTTAYCEGAYGRLSFQADCGATKTIRIDVYNNSGATRTVKLYMIILYSPWILDDESDFPVALDFPQGSTLYVTLEPLGIEQTKAVKIGKKRAASFGDSTDYYYIASGTGIINANYTFETVEVGSCVLVAGGYGACVSIIGVDVRG